MNIELKVHSDEDLELPPEGEVTYNPAPPRKEAIIAPEALPKRKLALIIQDDNDIYFGDDQSAPTFMSVIKDMGYAVKFEKANETIYTTWKRYDVIVWSCGDDYTAINAPISRQMLVEYVTKGGRLILESGNIAAWNKEFGGATILNLRFRQNVLYATKNWVYHDVGDLTLKTEHPIATTPNALPETIEFTPNKPGDRSGDANAVRILSDLNGDNHVPGATGIYNWSYIAYEGRLVNDSVTSKSYGLIASESEENNGGRIVYFAFDIDDIDSPDIQRKLIQNSVNWLREEETISDEGMHRRLCNMPKVPERVLPKGIEASVARLIRMLDKKWVNGTELTYCFLNQPSNFAGSDEQKKVVRDGFNIWKSVGIGLKFEEVSNPSDAKVRIGFKRGDGAWSYVGRDLLKVGPNERTMNFGWDLIKEDPRGVDTTTHEIGHTMGFPHEHQNPESGIEWNEDAVYDWASRTQGWDKETTFWNIIRKIEPDEVEGSSWDNNSIMHYPFKAGLINKPEKYKTQDLRPAPGISERDITWARTFYPPIDPKSDYTELKVDRPVPLKLSPGEQKDFLLVLDDDSDDSCMKTYNMETVGKSDTVMVLFEEKNGKRHQLAANDDSAEDYNAHISWELSKGKRYILSIRLYHDWVKGETTVKLSAH